MHTSLRVQYQLAHRPLDMDGTGSQMTIDAGSPQGHHGNKAPKPGSKPRGRPRKRKEVAGTIDGRPVTKVNSGEVR